MARKFWEKLSNTQLQFYDEPQLLIRTEAEARIIELQSILNSPDSVKAILVQSTPGVESEAAFDQIFLDELNILAGQNDFMQSDTVTIQETLEVVDHIWLSPSDMSLGPGAIQAVCGEEVGNEAIQAIDGVNNTNWQHDFDHVHEITIDLGYPVRIDALRISKTAIPAGPLQLSGVDVFVAKTVAKLDDPASEVGTNLSFVAPNETDDATLTIRNGQFVRIRVGSTGHASNHITIREILLRIKPRTAQT